MPSARSQPSHAWTTEREDALPLIQYCHTEWFQSRATWASAPRFALGYQTSLTTDPRTSVCSGVSRDEIKFSIVKDSFS